MNATPPAEKPAAPQADAVSQGYAKKAESVRGSKKMSEKLEAVGAIAEAISLEVQKVIIGKSHVIDNVMVNILSNGNLCLLYTSPSPRDQRGSRMPSSA